MHNANRLYHRRQAWSGTLCLALLLCLCAFLMPLQAAFEDASAGARMRGLAGAGSAVTDDSETVWSQPAGLAVLTRTEAAFSYGKLFTGLSDGSDLADGICTLGHPVGKHCGIGLAYKNIALKDAYSEQTIAAAVGYRPHRFYAVGVTVKYLGIDYSSDDYTRLDPVFTARHNKNALDADAGLLLFLSPAVTVSYSRRNLLGADVGLAETAALAAEDRAGLAYREDSFLMAAEYVQTGKDQRLLAGMEKTLARGLFALRLGAGWGNRDFRKITSGLRVNAGQCSIDYAFDFPLGGIDGTTGTHYVTLVLRAAPAGMKRPPTTKKPAPVIKQALALPGMAPAQPVCLLPELLPAPTGALRTPLTALLDFSTAISSSTERLRYGIESSTTNIIIVVPPTAKKAAAKMKEDKLQEGAGGVVPPVIAPEPAAAEHTASRAAPGTRTHRVTAGDTLPVLAEKYYGRRNDWYRIYEANRDRIEKGALEPDQILIIP